MMRTKAEIAMRVCEKTNISKDDAANLVENTFEIIKASLERGEPVKISGFGRFMVRTKRQRKGRNPKTGAELVIRERKVLSFKSSQMMKKTVATTQVVSNG